MTCKGGDQYSVGKERRQSYEGSDKRKVNVGAARLLHDRILVRDTYVKDDRESEREGSGDDNVEEYLSGAKHALSQG